MTYCSCSAIDLSSNGIGSSFCQPRRAGNLVKLKNQLLDGYASQAPRGILFCLKSPGPTKKEMGIFVRFLIFGNTGPHVPNEENEMQLASTVASWYKVASLEYFDLSKSVGQVPHSIMMRKLRKIIEDEPKKICFSSSFPIRDRARSQACHHFSQKQLIGLSLSFS